MKQVFDYLKRHRSRFVSELVEYVRFPSVSAQPDHRKDLKACVDWIEAHCRGIGLDTHVVSTSGNPILVARTFHGRSGKRTGAGRRGGGAGRSASAKPHYLVYGHYDVQPAEPFALWMSPPFEPTIRGRSLFGRGASDNKGQHFAHLKAVEAFLKTGTELPCDLTFVIEGEEEVGSDNLPLFLKKQRAELACAGVVVSDNGMPGKGRPSLTYALRGIVAVEVFLDGPSRDLHSGIYGGSVDNPAMVLCQMLGSLRDKRGRIAIPGYYDDVARLSPFERRQLARGEEAEAAYRKFLGVPQLFGERGYTPVEQRTARPTVEINGLTSGYQGDGSKTIVPAKASAKLTFRIVPNQDPDKVRKQILSHLKSLCPPTVRMQLRTGHSGEPYLVSPTGPKAGAAMRALKAAFGAEPSLKREGGSIPIVNEFRKVLGAETLLLGLALPDDNPHSPNEKFDLDCFERGMRMSAHLWAELVKEHPAATRGVPRSSVPTAGR